VTAFWRFHTLEVHGMLTFPTRVLTWKAVTHIRWALCLGLQCCLPRAAVWKEASLSVYATSILHASAVH
jgi:hypothetical protein